MRVSKQYIEAIASLAITLLLVLCSARPGLAQSAGTMFKLYVDPTTHLIYTQPGRNRRLFAEIPSSALVSQDLEAQQQKTQQTVDSDHQQLQQLAARNQYLEASNAALAQQIAEIKPAWRSYVDNFQDKFRVGTLVYADYRFYTHTSFQPQELTQITNPGPWNDDYSSFDISRAYLNFFFFPTDDWIVRITPNIYKTIGAAAGGTEPGNVKIGSNTAFGSNLDGNLGYRLKYGYLQYKSLWDKLSVAALKGGTVSFGEIPNPLVAWEEDLYGFRYVNLTPWNYLSLSSTQLGLSMEGPIKPFGGETTYADYGIGVYNNANFHQYEQSNLKQVMGRLSIYPFGQSWRFQGLGLTGFYNYGYGNTAPDSESIPTVLKGPNAHITRIAALLHYSAEQWGVAGEFDYGNNAFSAANMFSGSAPGDEYGFVTGTPVTTGTIAGNTCSTATPCYNPASGFGAQTAAWNALLNNGQSRQVGADFFGHFHIPGTNLTPFGMAEWFQPNNKVATDPLDFFRFIAGVSYQFNEYLRFAIDSQNVLYYHNQMSLPVSYLEKFNYVPGSKLNGQLLPKTGSIPYLVPFDVHSIFFNAEFSY
ncbi:MAG TPA: hypothetical protein VFB15_11050 [Candidatus Binataceae bacterium]|nr:hypothetical protein [Candidatus Binataceae bacterium]